MKEKRTIYEREETVTDNSTGEALSTKKTSVCRIPQEPPYMKVYLNDLCRLTNVPKANEDVLKLLLRKLDYDGYITISTRYREEIQKKLNITAGTLRNRIQLLKQQGLIRVVSNNEYEANPHFFGRGNWADIYNRRIEGKFKLTITYDTKGNKKIKTEVVEEAEQPEQDEQQQLDLTA